MLLDPAQSQLVLIDYQERLMPHIVHGESVVANALRLGRIARLLGVPVIGTEENPAGLGPNLPQIRELCAVTLSKMSFSACADGLTERLRPISQAPAAGNARSLPRHLQKAISPPPAARNSIVLAGCESHVCLLQTALDLLDEEFEVWVVTDACGSRRESDRDAAFDRLAGNGAELLSTEMLAFEWLRTADHPQFKAVLALLK
jgi:nicotinamidase-related amidase